MMTTFIAEKALGYGQFAAGAVDTSTLLSTIVVGGVAGIPAGASLALVQAEAQAIRWRDDGVPPTSTVGQPLAVGVLLVYTAQQFAALRFISQTAGAIVNVTFYGQGG